MIRILQIQRLEAYHWPTGHYSSMIVCHPRSSRRTTDYHTDFRRLSNVAQRKLHPLYSRESQRRDLVDPEWRQRWYSKPRAISLWRNEFQVRSVMTASVRWHIMNIHSIFCIQWIFLVPDVGIEPTFENYKYSVLTIGRIRRISAFGGI